MICLFAMEFAYKGVSNSVSSPLEGILFRRKNRPVSIPTFSEDPPSTSSRCFPLTEYERSNGLSHWKGRQRFTNSRVSIERESNFRV